MAPELMQGGTSPIPANSGVNYPMQRDIGQGQIASIASQLLNTRIPDYAAKYADMFSGVNKLADGVVRVAQEIERKEEALNGIKAEQELLESSKATQLNTLKAIEQTEVTNFKSGVFDPIKRDMQAAMTKVDSMAMTEEQRERLRLHVTGSYLGIESSAQTAYYRKHNEYAMDTVNLKTQEVLDEMLRAPMTHEQFVARIENAKASMSALAYDVDGKENPVLANKVNKVIDRSMFGIADKRVQAMADHGMTADISTSRAVLAHLKAERPNGEKPFGGSDHAWTTAINRVENHVSTLEKQAENEGKQRLSDIRVAGDISFRTRETVISDLLKKSGELLTQNTSESSATALKNIEVAQKRIDELATIGGAVRSARAAGGKDLTAAAMGENMEMRIQQMREQLDALRDHAARGPSYKYTSKQIEEELAKALGVRGSMKGGL